MSKSNELTNTIIDYLNLNGAYAWRNNTTGVYDTKKHTFRKNPKQVLGVADILCVLEGGTFVAIEVKTTDKLSKHQKNFGQKITERNGIYIVAHEFKDVESENLFHIGN